MGETEEERIARLVMEYEANKKFAQHTNREYNIWEAEEAKKAKKKGKR